MFWLIVIVVLYGAAGIFGWFAGRSQRLEENKFNRKLHQQLIDDRRTFEGEVEQHNRDNSLWERKLKEREHYLDARQKAFEGGYFAGRVWLAAFVAEADRALDESICEQLRLKARPAPRAADEVAMARKERRWFKERAKFLEYQLKSYEEYFPFLEQFREVILDESVNLATKDDNFGALEDADPVLQYMRRAEYDALSVTERNQRALDRYLTKHLSDAGIGRCYERYIGYLHEFEGWQVDYHGIVEGFDDLGRDLICKKGHEILIIQTKCWSQQKQIHEKHIFQLFGSTVHYLMNCGEGQLFSPDVTPWFITTTKLSPVAKRVAKLLNIHVKEEYQLIKSYPMIKCNINQSTHEKIYHLPFDQQYDRTKIIPSLGELYVTTVEEAESKGFRRAWRHRVAPN